MKQITAVNAMESAFRKAVEDGTTKDKEAIKAAIFGQKPGVQIPPRTIKPAPKPGKIAVEKIQAAVDSVSKKNESKTLV